VCDDALRHAAGLRPDLAHALCHAYGALLAIEPPPQVGAARKYHRSAAEVAAVKETLLLSRVLYHSRPEFQRCRHEGEGGWAAYRVCKPLQREGRPLLNVLLGEDEQPIFPSSGLGVAELIRQAGFDPQVRSGVMGRREARGGRHRAEQP